MGILEIYGTKSSNLKGKRILIGVTGSIAAIEVPHLIREIIRHSGEPIVVLSPEATRFVAIDALTWCMDKPPITEISGLSEHIKWTVDPNSKIDLCMICPASANTISKLANGIADTSVTLVSLAAIGAKIPVLIVPAAHTVLLENPVTERNVLFLKELGAYFSPVSEDEKKFKFPPLEQLMTLIFQILLPKKFLTGKRFLISGGATREYFDNVRFLSNPSTGFTALQICKALVAEGAEIMFILGEGNNIKDEYNAFKTMIVRSTSDMYNLIHEELSNGDYHGFISVAAVSDYKPEFSKGKIASEQQDLFIRIVPTIKIIDKVRTQYPNLYILAFKAEVGVSESELITRGRKLLNSKNLNIVCANWVGEPEKGFIAKTNEVFILRKGKEEVIHLKTRKDQIAHNLVKLIIEDFQLGGGV